MRHTKELLRVTILLSLFFSMTVFGNDRDTRSLIRIANVQSGQQTAVRLVTLFGTLNVRSRYFLSDMLRPEEAKRTTLLHPRLFLMLQRIADQFPGKTIEIVSAHRVSRTRKDDTHNLGRAVDFRVSGVKNSDLYEFAKTLPKCGTGYYPKADFVHLDVRDETVTWTDYFHTNRDCSVVADSNEGSEERDGDEIEFLSVWNDDKINLQLVTQNGIINSRSREIRTLQQRRVCRHTRSRIPSHLYV